MAKQYLRTSLNMEMHGIQQVLALYFNTLFASADHINLSRYKILINEPFHVNEPLHDILCHVKNIQEEPSHVP